MPHPPPWRTNTRPMRACSNDSCATLSGGNDAAKRHNNKQEKEMSELRGVKRGGGEGKRSERMDSPVVFNACFSDCERGLKTAKIKYGDEGKRMKQEREEENSGRLFALFD